MYTVDCMDREWYIMQPNSGGRACARCHYEGDARMIADALNEAAQLRAENERLRAALEELLAASRWYGGEHPMHDPLSNARIGAIKALTPLGAVTS